MRIRVWNAFASNNSGSYTIVGSFKTSELAAEVAAELTALVKAHSAWLLTEPEEGAPEESSPLAAFVEQHGLNGHERIGRDDEWPQYAKDIVPSVFAIDHRVILHHDYTVTMPAALGQYFYARGGRVDHELNHAHHPIVSVFELWVPYRDRHGTKLAAKVTSIVEALNTDDGPLVTLAAPWHEPAWQSKEGFGEADLTVGAIFDDLALGFTAVQRIAAAHGLRTSVKVFEQFEGADPLAFLRPSAPELPGRRCSLVLEALGNSKESISRALAPLVHYDHAKKDKLLAAVPSVIMTGLVRARAERIAALLREAGATVGVKEEAR